MYIVPVALMIKLCWSKHPPVACKQGTRQAPVKLHERAEAPIYCHFIWFPNLEQISGKPPSSIHTVCHTQEQQVSDATGCDCRGRPEWLIPVRSFPLFTATIQKLCEISAHVSGYNISWPTAGFREAEPTSAPQTEEEASC